MKKSLISLFTIVAVVFLSLVSFPETVYAELSATETEFTVPQGGSYSIGVTRYGYVGCYLVGNTSQKTYIVHPDDREDRKLAVYVGLDEQAATFHIYIYSSYSDENLDIVVNVNRIYGDTYVGAGKTTNTTTTNSTNTMFPVAYTNGTTGTLQLLNGNKRGLFYSTEGNPIASFSVQDSNKNAMAMSVGAEMVYINGMYYITVNTNRGGKIYMTATDMEAIRAYGVYGLYLNGNYLGWEN